MRTYVYTPSWVEVVVEGRRQRALTFVVKRDHRQFACFTDDEIVSIIASSAGANGSNFDYLQNTVRALHALGVPDADLDALFERVGDYVTSGRAAALRTSPVPARSP
jgi:cation transport regulator ChaC